jgi:hypothetical protein
VKAMIRDPIIVNEMLVPNARNWVPIWFGGRKKRGVKTMIVVSVPERIASPTSFAPSMAAFSGSTPISRCRKMFSTTTTALSMSIPTASISPDRVMMFSEFPATYRMMTAKISDTGMAAATMKVGVIRRRKMKSMTTARSPPTAPACPAASAPRGSRRTGPARCGTGSLEPGLGGDLLQRGLHRPGDLHDVRVRLLVDLGLPGSEPVLTEEEVPLGKVIGHLATSPRRTPAEVRGGARWPPPR